MRAVVVVAVMMLAGCSSSPGGACSTLPEVVPVLISPAPGAVGVSTGIGALTLGNGGIGDPVSLRGQNGTVIALGAITLVAGSETVSVPQLSSGTTYSVIVTLAPQGCSPGGPTAIASFTTQ